MGKDTLVEWAKLGLDRGASWNPIIAFDPKTRRRGWACVKATPACLHCYAERLNLQGRGKLGTRLTFTKTDLRKVDIQLVPAGQGDSAIDAPMRWRKSRGIFVESMSDLFGEFVPSWMIDEVFNVMETADHHRYAVLTKRVGGMVDYLLERYRQDGREQPPRHIWFGFSAGLQSAVNQAWPHMANLRAAFPDAVLWASNEPALEVIDWTGWESILNWLVTGGESGPDARPMHPRIPRVDRDWCRANGVPFFFKQGSADWGPYFKDFDSFPPDLRIREFPIFEAPDVDGPHDGYP